jgi:tryptophanyl-tRNA synthetase
VLTCYAYMGELSRMTQYKDKSAKQGTNIPAGLFAYPVLMAADILLYQTDLVPVGDDQKQHVEITRDLALRMNHLYPGEGDAGELFKIPEFCPPPVGARIMSLQNPTAKMSKSDEDPNASVFLNESDKDIEKKIKRAVTDSGSEITWSDDKPGIKNLITIQAAITGKKPDEIVAAYAGKQYGHLKVDTAAIVVEAVRPIREKTDELLRDMTYLDQILNRGAEIARERAEKTILEVYDRIGFVPGRRAR